MHVDFRCRTRACGDCEATKAQSLAQMWVQGIKLMRRAGTFRKCWGFKLLTVTLRHKGDVAERIQRIHKYFNTLWYSLYKGVDGTGAICTIEISGREHVHLHAFIYAPFRAIQLVKLLWFTITGDSYICDIRYVRGKTDDALFEVLKYPYKNIKDADAEAIAAYCAAMKSKRRYWLKGIFYRAHVKALCIAYCIACLAEATLTDDYPLRDCHNNCLRPSFRFRVVLDSS